MRRGRGKGVRIAILDSGVERSHPWLRDVKWGDDIAVEVENDGQHLRIKEGEGADLFGHGTAVAGIIHQVAPEAEIGSFRVLGGSIESKTSIVLEGARQAIERGYHIVNCSFGCTIVDHIIKYKDWVDEAYLRHVHVVAACNNYNPSRQEWPSSFTSVISVNMARCRREGSLYYRRDSLVEFAAGGVDVEVAWLSGAVRRMTGSSFAAPRVAGMLACLLGEIPGLSPTEVKALLHRVAEPWSPDLSNTEEFPAFPKASLGSPKTGSVSFV